MAPQAGWLPQRRFLSQVRNAAAETNPHRIETRRQARVRASQAPARAAAGTGQGRRSVSVPIGPGKEGDPHLTVGTEKLMEVEVKLNLIKSESHSLVAQLLSEKHTTTYEQENFFFDGQNKELSSQLAVLRVRIYNGDEKAELTLKGKATLKDGIGIAPERNEGLDPEQAHAFVSEPGRLLSFDSALMNQVRRTFQPEALLCMGGFRNTRKVYNWNNHTLELDETHYDFGTLYELECETDQPDKLRGELEAFLEEHGVAYRHSTSSKFARFINKSLD